MLLFLLKDEIMKLCHALLGKGCANNIARWVLKSFLIVRPYGLASINAKSAVVPIPHILDDDIRDFAFGIARLINIKINFGRTRV